jgi:hypothetical protein
MASQKRRLFNADIKATGKKEPAQLGLVQCLTHCSSLKKILEQNQSVCWSIVVTKNPTVASPYFGAFPSDHIPKVTLDVNEHFFTQWRFL